MDLDGLTWLAAAVAWVVEHAMSPWAIALAALLVCAVVLTWWVLQVVTPNFVGQIAIGFARWIWGFLLADSAEADHALRGSASSMTTPLDDSVNKNSSSNLNDDKPVNPVGGSGRGTYCTPPWLTALIGEVDLDPCANESGTVQATRKLYGRGAPEDDGLAIAPTVDAETRTFVNPPYNAGQVIKWVRAYAHTDYIFLLRFDTSTVWFAELLKDTSYVWFPYLTRINFVAPAGADKPSNNPFPHALFFASDPPLRFYKYGFVLEVTDEVRKELLRPPGAKGDHVED